MAGLTRARRGRSRRTARKAANSPVMAALARTGLAARGVQYVVLGIIAVEIAVGSSRQQADQTGAVRLVASTPFGSVLLWLLAIGFTGLMLWQLGTAVWGSPGQDGGKPTKRLGALVKAVFYAVVAVSIFKYAIGLGAPQSSDKQSQDLTAKLMHAPGGQVLVAVVGVAITVVGLCLAVAAWQKRFMRNLWMDRAGRGTRTFVERLGQVGGIARGAVAVTVGIFLIVAAVDASPQQAKGMDSALRTLARTPLGPWLLVAVAVGLAVFGLYSFCEARWRDVRP